MIIIDIYRLEELIDDEMLFKYKEWCVDYLYQNGVDWYASMKW